MRWRTRHLSPKAEKPDAPGSRKRLVLWGTVAAAVVALAAGAAHYLAPWQSDLPSAPKHPPTAYFEFPKIKTDLKPTGRFRHMITLQVVAELTADGLPRLDAVKSKILDGFHVRLRELQQDDLVGKAGTEGLRTNFLGIVNAARAPARASDVLFTEMLVQ